MLRKVIDKGSIPMGQFRAKQELVKGRLVKVDFAKNEVDYATNEADVFGFCTLRIEDAHGGDFDRDTIPKGALCVVYTLVKNNVWGTSECENIEKLKVGDTVKVGTNGKLTKDDGGSTGKMVVYEVGQAVGHPMVSVLVK